MAGAPAIEHPTADPSPSAPLTPNGWTGGQYSLFRALFGAHLAVLLALATMRAPGIEVGVIGAGFALAAVAFALGWHDRPMAAIVATGLVAWWPHAGLPGKFLHPLLCVPLLVHLTLPSAPFGSIAGRGRTDPRGGWYFPEPVRAILWGSFAAFAAAVGASGLLGWDLPGPDRFPLLARGVGPFGTAALFALLALPIGAIVPVARPWLWIAATLAIAPGVVDGYGLALLWIHVWTFDPGWIRPLAGTGRDLVFYDGACGFCHRSVRILLAEDRAGVFSFAPRTSEACVAALPAEVRAELPESIVVVPEGRPPRIRSGATVRMMLRLGGIWRILGLALAAVPRPLRDLAYRGVARVRHRLYARPETACPIVPPDLRERFLPGAEKESLA